MPPKILKTTITTITTTTTTSTSTAPVKQKPKPKAAPKTKTSAPQSPAPKARSSAQVTAKGKASPKPKAVPKPKTTATAAATPAAKSPNPKGKATTTAKAAATPKASPKAKAAPKAKATPVTAALKTKVPSRTVHDALFVTGVSLEPVIAANWRTTPQRTEKLCAAIPAASSGNPRLTFLDGSAEHRALTASLLSRLSENGSVPKPVATALAPNALLLDRSSALLPAVSALIAAPKVLKDGPVTNRAWASSVLSHCPIFHDEALEACGGGAAAGVLRVHDKLLAAFVRAIQHGGKVGSDMRNKTGLRIWIRKGVPEAEGADGVVVQMGLQLFYAMQTRGWKLAIVTDGPSFITVHRDADVLRVSPSASVIAPTGLSLLGALTELLLADSSGSIASGSGSRATALKKDKAVKKEPKPKVQVKNESDDRTQWPCTELFYHPGFDERRAVFDNEGELVLDTFMDRCFEDYISYDDYLYELNNADPSAYHINGGDGSHADWNGGDVCEDDPYPFDEGITLEETASDTLMADPDDSDGHDAYDSDGYDAYREAW